MQSISTTSLQYSAERASPPLGDFVKTLNPEPQHGWAWANFEACLRRLCEQEHVVHVLEIGGGRNPLFSLEEIKAMKLQYTVNDIDQSELDKAPASLSKFCFDIAGEEMPAEAAGSFDLIFSKMVFEHVRDAQRAYSNMFKILNSGGVFFNFHPVLYSPAFVINWLLPDSLTRKIVHTVTPGRVTGNQPKFPAFYSNCEISDAAIANIHDAGFAEVFLIPFWGTSYFQNIPGISFLDRNFTNFVMERRMKKFASFCFCLGQKP